MRLHATAELTLVDRRGRTWLTLSWPRAAAWATIVTPVVVACGALRLAAPDALLWPTVFLAVLTVGSGAVPDSSLGLATIACFAVWWFVAVPAPALPWTLLAAVSLLAFHLAVAVVAAGPPGCTVTGDLRWRLLARTLPLLAMTVAVALVAEGAAGRFEPGALVVAATLVAAGLVPWLVARR